MATCTPPSCYEVDGVKYLLLGGGGAEQDPILPGGRTFTVPADYPPDLYWKGRGAAGGVQLCPRGCEAWTEDNVHVESLQAFGGGAVRDGGALRTRQMIEEIFS